jgi:hypothetical protein
MSRVREGISRNRDHATPAVLLKDMKHCSQFEVELAHPRQLEDVFWLRLGAHISAKAASIVAKVHHPFIN